MIAIIYQKPKNHVVSIISDVTSYTETDIIGKNAQVRGIDTEQVGFVIVEPAAFNKIPEDITRETVNYETVDGLPVPVPGLEVIGQREIIKVVLTEGGLEYGIGDVLPLDQVVDIRDRLPLTPEQEKTCGFQTWKWPWPTR